LCNFTCNLYHYFNCLFFRYL